MSTKLFIMTLVNFLSKNDLKDFYPAFQENRPAQPSPNFSLINADHFRRRHHRNNEHQTVSNVCEHQTRPYEKKEPGQHYWRTW